MLEPEPEARYELILTATQCRVMNDALEAFMRMHLGQIRNALDPVVMSASASAGHDIEPLCTMIRDELYPRFRTMGGGASYGITSPEVHDSARIATDIREVVRRQLAHDRDPKPGLRTVDYDMPMHWHRDQPLPRFRRLDEGEGEYRPARGPCP